jgi:hypothetical protein
MSEGNHKIKSVLASQRLTSLSLSENPAEGCCLKILWLLMELDAHLKETVREL